MFYTIYKTTNLINNKIYIGKHQTKDLNDEYFGSGKHLQYAIKKHGIDNFTKDILFIFDNEHDMNAKEAELVTEEFCLREDTYNICVGGQGGFSHINRNVSERIAKNQIARRNADKAGARIKARQSLDRLYADRDWIKAKGDKRAETMLSRYGVVNITHFKGKKHTSEWKQNHSAFMKTQTGSKNSQYNTMWITNSQENKKIKKDVDFIPEGWYKGRKLKQ